MTIQIPLFKLNFDQREIDAVVDTIKSQWISMGPRCLELEDAFAESVGTEHAVALTNCTAALHLAMIILNIGPGDEVIVPSLTFAATANCVRYVGATPIFADVCDLNDLTLDIKDVERKITKHTKAIIPVHFGGFAVDMDPLMLLAERHNLDIVEDACHGPLSEYAGQKLGSIGTMGCFSFFSNKNISTGEGGMLVTNNSDIAARVKLLRSHGMTTMSYQRASGHATSYDVVDTGYNYRMDDMRAALGLVQLQKLPEDLAIRAKVRAMYEDALSGLPGIVVPFEDRRDASSNYIMPIVLTDSDAEKRDVVRDRLLEDGIQTSVHYPAIHRFSQFKTDVPTKLPVTEYITDAEITLPMHSGVQDSEINYILERLSVALK